MSINLPLFLSDIAGSELFLVLFFVLMFFGSKSIPSIARTLGKAMRQVKNASAEVQEEIRKSGMDIKNDLNIKEIIKETESEISQPLDQAMTDVQNAVHYNPVKKTKKKSNSNKTENIKQDENG